MFCNTPVALARTTEKSRIGWGIIRCSTVAYWFGFSAFWCVCVRTGGGLYRCVPRYNESLDSLVAACAKMVSDLSAGDSLSLCEKETERETDKQRQAERNAETRSS